MRLRDLFEQSRQPLFHGTSLLSAICIVQENRIDASTQYEGQPNGVSLTRDYRLAREFGTYWDRKYPVVFVFDWDRLRHRHKIMPYRDFDPQAGPNVGSEEVPWPRREKGGAYRPEEHEEVVLSNIAPLDKMLISINTNPRHLIRAAANREYLKWMVEEYGDLMHATGITTQAELARRIKQFGSHPLINKWAPPVTVKPGTENDGWM